MNTNTIINEQIKTMEILSGKALSYLFSNEITVIPEEKQEMYKKLANKHLGTEYKKDDIITVEELKYFLQLKKEVESVAKQKISYDSKIKSISNKINRCEKRVPQLF